LFKRLTLFPIKESENKQNEKKFLTSFSLKNNNRTRKTSFVKDIQEAFQKRYQDNFSECKDNIISKQNILPSSQSMIMVCLRHSTCIR